MTPGELQRIAFRAERALFQETGHVVLVAIVQGGQVAWSGTSQPEKLRLAVKAIHQQLDEGDYREQGTAPLIRPFGVQ